MEPVRSIQYSGNFDSAHRLVNYDGKCSHLHGHTYHVHAHVIAEMDEKGQFVIDFTEIKRIIDRYDHCTLVWAKDSELIDLVTRISRGKICLLEHETTAENIAEAIANEIMAFVGDRLREIDVCVRETPKGEAQFRYKHAKALS